MGPFKRVVKFGAVSLVVFASTFALADTIQIGSYATGASAMGNTNTAVNYAGFSAVSTTPMTGTNSSFMLSPGSSWGSALANSTWVGEAANAGPVGTVNPALGYYTFTTTFTALSSSAYSGMLSLMADDTAEVLLNGTVLVPFGTTSASDTHCASGMPSCTVADTVTLGGLNLLSGTNANTLTFIVHQAGNINSVGGDPSGLDFDATLSSGSVPEPSTLALMALGMAAIGGGVLLRKPALLKA
jgi:hypothetical protein